MKVLSLFDGISCFRVALGDTPVEYLASEIDKNAIKISKKNFPGIQHLGSVCDVSGVTGVDILVGGSPCTDLSIAMKGRKGLEGDRSKLFYEYVRIWRECKPKWFILENVASMSEKDKCIISNILGIHPVMLNASLVSAQSRKRLFWTNIPIVGLPADRGIVLRDILEAEVDDKYFIKNLKMTVNNPGNNKTGLIQVGHIADTNAQANRVYSPDGKSVTLSACAGGSGGKTGLYELKKRQQANLRPVDGKAHCLTATNYKGTQANGTTLVVDSNVTIKEKSIRRLTPRECERLMGLPDDYTDGISMTARYKAVGNAFHVEIMKWILKFIPKDL
jgi:DNA-cytosine methyltransferase